MPTLSHITQHYSTTAPPPLIWELLAPSFQMPQKRRSGTQLQPRPATNLSVPCFTLPQFLYLRSETSDEYAMDRDEVLHLKPQELLATETPLNLPLEERCHGLQ